MKLFTNKIPFTSLRAEMEAIEAKVCVWRLTMRNCKLHFRRTRRLAHLITEADKVTTTFRAMQ